MSALSGLLTPPGSPNTGWITLPAISAMNSRAILRASMTLPPISRPTLPMTPTMLRAPAGAVGPTMKSGPPRK